MPGDYSFCNRALGLTGHSFILLDTKFLFRHRTFDDKRSHIFPFRRRRRRLLDRSVNLPPLFPRTNTHKTTIIMGIIDDIKSNSITELHLTNDPDDYFGKAQDFADAMDANTSIETVIFDEGFVGCLFAKDRAIVVSSVGRLPNVQRVVLKGSLLMIGVCVVNLINDAKKLNELRLEGCTLQGVPSDFDLLRDALSQNPGIKVLEIVDCEATNTEVELDKVLNDLPNGLSIEIAAS